MKILGVASTHLKKGEFQILENVDFSNIERAKALQHNATNIEIKQRLDQLESIKQYPLLLKDIARLDYNDIHFDRQVFKDLCLGFVDNLSLVNDDAIRFKGSSFFNPICVCIFRNFGNFLEKWISHYSLLGITKFAMISCDDKVNEFSKLKVYFEKSKSISGDGKGILTATKNALLNRGSPIIMEKITGFYLLIPTNFSSILILEKRKFKKIPSFSAMLLMVTQMIMTRIA